MPVLIPEKPDFPADRGAEKKVWKALAAQLPDDAVLIHGLRITRRSRDREGDLIVLWPGNGVAVIEVKGGYMVPASDGKFKQSSATGRTKTVDPIEQARELMYTLKDWISDHTSIKTNYNFVFMAALPFADINTEWHSTRATRKQVIDKRDLVDVAGKVRSALEDNGGLVVVPDAYTIDQMVSALETKVLDVHDPVQLAELLDERSEFVASLLEANEAKLDFVSAVPRFAVQGPAGSGKTAMAVKLAHRLTNSGLRVLYVCYTALLAADLKRRDEELDNKSTRIAAITTLHALGPQYGVKVPQNVPDDYWEVQSPKLIKEAADSLPLDKKFDAVIVDEAQDFAPAWWDTISALLRDPSQGRLYAFGDTGQTLFSRGGAHQLNLVPLTLDTNLRNTQEIAAGANRLTSTPAPCIGPEGPDIHFCEVPEWADVTTAGDAVASSMLNHYRPTDIALLQTWHRHPVHVEWEKQSRSFYNKQYWEGEDIFYSTVMKFKGLERHCVVLVIDGFAEINRARELLYVGMTRAQDLLIVVSKRSMLSEHIDQDLMNILDESRFELDEDIYGEPDAESESDDD